MLEVNTNLVLQLNADVLLHSIEDLDKYWAFNIRSGDHYSLNESAYFLLLEFKQPRRIRAVLNKFKIEYDLTSAVANADGLEMIIEFLDKELLTRRQQ